MSISVALIVLLSGMAGAWYHWIEVAKRGEADHGITGFVYYMFVDNKAGSGKTLTAFATVMGALYAAGTFDMVRMDAFIEALQNGVIYSPMLGAIATAFTAGYACDSKLNQSKE